MYKNQQ